MEQESQMIQGTVLAVIYQNPENGYCVLKVRTEQGEAVTVVGVIPMCVVGERLAIVGRWTRHQSFGQQFEAEFLERLMPETTSEILAFLSSRAVKGIGPKMAEKIVSRSVKAGFNWDSVDGALDKLDEEAAELRQAVEAGEAVDSPHGVREEIGDALFVLCKIAQMSGVDPEDALHRACDKYQTRFRRVADAADKPLSDYTEAEKIALWKQAKNESSSLTR